MRITGPDEEATNYREALSTPGTARFGQPFELTVAQAVGQYAKPAFGLRAEKGLQFVSLGLVLAGAVPVLA